MHAASWENFSSPSLRGKIEFSRNLRQIAGLVPWGWLGPHPGPCQCRGTLGAVRENCSPSALPWCWAGTWQAGPCHRACAVVEMQGKLTPPLCFPSAGVVCGAAGSISTTAGGRFCDDSLPTLRYLHEIPSWGGEHGARPMVDWRPIWRMCRSCLSPSCLPRLRRCRSCRWASAPPHAGRAVPALGFRVTGRTLLAAVPTTLLPAPAPPRAVDGGVGEGGAVPGSGSSPLPCAACSFPTVAPPPNSPTSTTPPPMSLAGVCGIMFPHRAARADAAPSLLSPTVADSAVFTFSAGDDTAVLRLVIPCGRGSRVGRSSSAVLWTLPPCQVMVRPRDHV